jgi:hypothetical protein
LFGSYVNNGNDSKDADPDSMSAETTLNTSDQGGSSNGQLGHSPPSTQELSSRETRPRCRRKVLSSSSSSAEDEHDDVMEEVDSDEGVTSEAEETEGVEGVELEEDRVEEEPVQVSRKRTSKGNTSATPKKIRKNAVIPRRFEFSVTIVLKGEDIDTERVEPLLDDFIKKHRERVIVCFERGIVEKHLHVQACMVVITTTPQQFKLQIERALGYEKGSRPVNLIICLRQLTGKDLHTVQGLVGYCRKTEDAVGFREITHKITDQDKTVGDLLFILHGRTESRKTKVALTGWNIISKMLVFLK